MLIVSCFIFIVSMIVWLLLKRPVLWYKALLVSTLAFGLSFAVVAISEVMYFRGITNDVEIWNGSVTNKSPVTKSCPTYWRDNKDSFCTEYTTREVLDYCEVVIDSKGNSSTKCHYKTQYKYKYSNETRYFIETTLGEYEISRVDNRGSITPNRWEIVQIGERVAKQNKYSNLLLVPDNAFSWLGDVELYDNIPNYPKVYDYYRAPMVIDTTKNGFYRENWNEIVSKFLAEHGSRLQLNVVVIITNHDVMFFESLMAHWNGGKKNDVILVFGLDDSNNIVWFRSNSFARGFGNTGLHANLSALGSANETNIEKYLNVIESNYQRHSMENMNYIGDQIRLSSKSLLIITLILSILVCVFWYSVKNNNKLHIRGY